MAFLILLIVATAILLAWLLVAVSRQALDDLHISRVHMSRPTQPRGRAGAEVSSEAPTRVLAPGRAVPEPVRSPTEVEPAVDEGMDTERAVREHLYGRSLRDRRA